MPPPPTDRPPRFTLVTRKAIGPDPDELAADPARARSAKLRVAIRTAAPARPADPAALGLPDPTRKGRR
jgi:16S rRNA (cytosine1402-N4)-methyltransferase